MPITSIKLFVSKVYFGFNFTFQVMRLSFHNIKVSNIPGFTFTEMNESCVR